MRICHWNKSNSAMKSRLSEVKNIISSHRPHFLGISEANIDLKKEHKEYFSIKDYSLHLGPFSPNGMIRLAVYIHKDIVFKVRPDLMSPELNSVWFEAGLKNKKNVLLNQTYRKWQQLGDANSISIPEQLERWLKYLTLWEKALDTGMEVVNIGDYNLNNCNWTNDNNLR